MTIQYNKQISEMYDNMHPDKDYNKEVAFLKSLLPASTKNILDVGCGTGIHAEKLAHMGYSVLGVDPSPNMIEVARRREQPTLSLSFKLGYIHNIRHNTLFDAAISMFNIPNHILTIQELGAYFGGVSERLQPGGLFVFDCFNQLAMSRDKPVVKTVGDRKLIPNYDPFTGILSMSYEGSVEHTLRHRVWSLDMLRESAIASGLSVISINKVYTNVIAEEDDYKVMFLCRRSSQ